MPNTLSNILSSSRQPSATGPTLPNKNTTQLTPFRVGSGVGWLVWLPLPGLTKSAGIVGTRLGSAALLAIISEHFDRPGALYWSQKASLHLICHATEGGDSLLRAANNGPAKSKSVQSSEGSGC